MDGLPSFLSNMLLGISEGGGIAVSLVRLESNGTRILTEKNVRHEEQGQHNIPLDIVH
jgi:hypothetical protein